MAFSHRLVLALVLVALAWLFSGAQSEDVCVFDGKTYKAGESFVNEGCTGQCQCHSGGGISCVSLCPPVQVNCQPSETLKHKQEAVASTGGRCSCNVPYCEKSACHHEDTTYQVGQTFTNKDCTSQCTCNEGGQVSCVSLCPPSQINCPPGKTESTKSVQAGSDGRCSCEVPTCV